MGGLSPESKLRSQRKHCSLNAYLKMSLPTKLDTLKRTGLAPLFQYSEKLDGATAVTAGEKAIWIIQLTFIVVVARCAL